MGEFSLNLIVPTVNIVQTNLKVYSVSVRYRGDRVESGGMPL